MNLITGIFFYKSLYWQKSSIYLVGQKLVKWQGVNFTDFLMGKFSDIGRETSIYHVDGFLDFFEPNPPNVDHFTK